MLLQAWDFLANCMLKMLRRVPEDQRIVVAAMLSHDMGNVEMVTILSNVPQLTTIQALDMAARAARSRPSVEPDEDFLPTLASANDGIVVVLNTRAEA
jgi:hypothetical protein